MNELDARASAHGIAVEYISAAGERRQVPDVTKRRLLDLLEVAEAERRPDAEPDVAARCHLPGFLRRGRAWGITCQLYGLRSRRNWGIGDFEDLAHLAEIAARSGADFLGVNPLHALFPGEPARSSPYSPSSRRFLNVLYIAPDLEPEFEDDAEARRLRDKARGSELVDYDAVAVAKLPVLRRMHERFATTANDARRQDFADFRKRSGLPLENLALFDALAAHFGTSAWTRWPQGFETPSSAAAQRFAGTNARDIEFGAWLQWLGDRQLARAQARARAAGQRIGLYLDLAVGVVGDGAAAWSRPELMAVGAHIGAPPDPFNIGGQDWGLVPPRPNVLAAERCAAFGDDLAAAMRHAGAMRLDHAMALRRMFWIPAELPAADGGFVEYPYPCMAAAVAGQSQRFGVVVVGEALGTVPPGFLRDLAAREVQSYRVLFFERRRDRGFRRTRAWPRRSLACVSTHDLPTLQGWWTSTDLAHRIEAGTVREDARDAEIGMRRRERERLWAALAAEGLVADDARLPGRLGPRHVEAVHRYLARTPARLVAVQLEDALGEVEQANLPGNTPAHPNWRRKVPVALEDLASQPLYRRVTRAMAQERPRP